MSEKAEPQLDFLKELEKPEPALKSQSEVKIEPEAASEEEKPKRKRVKHKFSQASKVNLGWAGKYYGNDPDDPKH